MATMAASYWSDPTDDMQDYWGEKRDECNYLISGELADETRKDDDVRIRYKE